MVEKMQKYALIKTYVGFLHLPVHRPRTTMKDNFFLYVYPHAANTVGSHITDIHSLVFYDFTSIG